MERKTIEEICDNFGIIIKKKLGNEPQMINPAKCRCCVKPFFDSLKN
jgi:hypothetical protein